MIIKKLLLLFLFVLFLGNIYAQTNVSGQVSGEWTAENSPYNVVGNIVVSNGATLNINPGVTVNFQGYYKFEVRGNLQAIGTETDSILFIPQNMATGWHGIRIISSNAMNRLSYCKIMYGKTNDGSYPDNVGGGLLLKDSDAHIDHCYFAFNQATDEGYGIGGAIYTLNTSNSTIEYCDFYNNYAYAEGGAIRFTSDLGSLIKHCNFIGNSCGYGGGAIHFYSCITNIFNTLFYDNTVTISSGGAISTGGMTGNSLIFTNCTMVGNTVDSYYSRGPAMSLAYGKAMLTNCIVYDNNVSSGDEIFIDVAGACEAHYCDLTEPNSIDYSGSNNIEENPLFEDEGNGNFHLLENSPCIDAGVAHYEMEDYYGSMVVTVDLSLFEFAGFAPDMGCYEYGMSSNDENIISNTKISANNYPNPFNPTTTISYSIDFNTYVDIDIYNVKGQKVIALFNGVLNAGNHSITWNGKDDKGKVVTSGVYFYKIRSANSTIVKKMIMMK